VDNIYNLFSVQHLKNKRLCRCYCVGDTVDLLVDELVVVCVLLVDELVCVTVDLLVDELVVVCVLLTGG
jgi:hypothetical protein